MQAGNGKDGGVQNRSLPCASTRQSANFLHTAVCQHTATSRAENPNSTTLPCGFLAAHGKLLAHGKAVHLMSFGHTCPNRSPLIFSPRRHLLSRIHRRRRRLFLPPPERPSAGTTCRTSPPALPPAAPRRPPHPGTNLPAGAHLLQPPRRPRPPSPATSPPARTSCSLPSGAHLLQHHLGRPLQVM
jgi:hypothetical protein